MRASFRFWIVLTLPLAAAPACAQRESRQPLTDVQIEQIREAGIDPNERVKLYTKFIVEHVETIKGLTKRGHSPARAKRLDGELQDLTALMDELGSNLDQYGDRKADLRAALKPLSEDSHQWADALHGLPSEAGFDLSLKEASDSVKDLADQSAQMLKEQTEYFTLHKDERGQERAEPKSP